MPMGIPGCPELAGTASIDRARIELDRVLFNFLKSLSFVDLGESIY